MVLIFGGTTEGKRVAHLLDVIGQAYIYSTKTDAHQEVKGKRIVGAMNQGAIAQFCVDNGVKIIVDAAHPFAVELHSNIHQAALSLGIKVIRYDRVFPDYSACANVRYFESYDAVRTEVLSSGFQKILALTGVQTILLLKPVWEQKTCYFRILETPLSKQKARASGIDQDYIIPMNPKADDGALSHIVDDLEIDLMLSKESGESGLVETKISTAEQCGIPLWIVRRPVLPHHNCTVDNDKDFLKVFYPLRKSEMKEEANLREGFTTGTCVTAAAKACFIALHEGDFPQEVSVQVPSGESTTYTVFPEILEKETCSCVVIKDAGDDPDVTHGKEIGCHLRKAKDNEVLFKKGKGIGEVTLPGLQVPVGEPAINPVPRRMICDMLQRMNEKYEVNSGYEVMPFVPEGELLALQTFNPRIGVVGGISILGTTGKVKPYSNEAFLASIREQIRVAKGNACETLVLSSGKRSESRLKPEFPDLHPAAFIHFGNLVGATLTMGVEEGFRQISIALMFGKAIKLAEGHLDTHSKKVNFNPDFAIDIAKECGYPASIYQQFSDLKLANAIVDIIPFSSDEPFYLAVAKRCIEQVQKAVNYSVKLRFYLLVGDEYWVCMEG